MDRDALAVLTATLHEATADLVQTPWEVERAEVLGRLARLDGVVATFDEREALGACTVEGRRAWTRFRRDVVKALEGYVRAGGTMPEAWRSRPGAVALEIVREA